MADHVAQLCDSHELMLQQSAKTPDAMPPSISLQLQESSSQIRRLRSWIETFGTHLRGFLSGAPGKSQREDLASFEGRLPRSEHQGAPSSGFWSRHCSEDVPIEVFVQTLGALRTDVRETDVRLAGSVLQVFSLRSERAAAAGELDAFEGLLALSPSAHKETIAGVLNVSQQVEGTIWKDPSMRKQASLVLARAMHEAKQRVKHARTASLGADVQERWNISQGRLRRADKALLDGGRLHLELAQARKEQAEMLRSHLKSVLAQCLPRPAGAAQSRYARFATAGPASTAVQLAEETDDYLAHTAAELLPMVLEEARKALEETDAELALQLHAAPEMSKWWEWLPDAASGEVGFLGFEAFMDHYRKAVGDHEKQLAFGGRTAALHSMLGRWEAALGGPVLTEASAVGGKGANMWL